MVPQSLLTPAQRTAYAIAVFIALFFVLALAATIPFIWESKSLWYKIGFDKTLLQTGKVAGICAAVLCFCQILLALRLKFLDRIFGLDRVYIIHKYNGTLVLSLIALHFVLVVLPEGLNNLPIGWKFWPEMLGAALFVTLGLVVAGAFLRRTILPYHLWRMLHRPLGYAIAAGIAIHVFNVSDSFTQGVPHYGLWGLIVTLVLTTVVVKVSAYRRKTPLKIENITSCNDDIISLEIAAPKWFHHAPGQFALLTLHDAKDDPNNTHGATIKAEPHPFTIASAPDQGSKGHNTLQFCIKQCGDWTRQLSSNISAGATVQGPYGLFSYLANQSAANLVFIAGGIGITPMLSMLRQLAISPDPPPVVLLWSLRTKKDMFLDEELRRLQQAMPSLRVHLFFTREQGGAKIDERTLAQTLEGRVHNSHVYLCGPERMTATLHKLLRNLGYPRSKIFFERFSL
ncbi:MAG: ferric reductase-like transmembrane domain-containing protein [Desulfopila sp.]